MNIIGFTGSAGCGKDTAAMALVRELKFHRFSFAAPIKNALNAMFGWSHGAWLDREWKEKEIYGFNTSPRQLAQTLGTEWARDIIDEDFWVKLLAYRISLSEHTRVVISDVRFENEATWIRSHGGYVVDVSRPLNNKVHAHTSELGVGWERINFKLANSGGVYELERETIALVKELL